MHGSYLMQWRRGKGSGRFFRYHSKEAQFAPAMLNMLNMLIATAWTSFTITSCALYWSALILPSSILSQINASTSTSLTYIQDQDSDIIISLILREWSRTFRSWNSNRKRMVFIHSQPRTKSKCLFVRHIYALHHHQRFPWPDDEKFSKSYFGDEITTGTMRCCSYNPLMLQGLRSRFIIGHA